MKIKAIILLLCFTSYFFDTIAVVNHMKATGEKHSGCCRKMMAIHAKASPQKCPLKKKDCSKDCFNCPLTIIILVAPPIEIPAHAIPFKNSFTGYKEKLINAYAAAAWKPPKGLLPSA